MGADEVPARRRAVDSEHDNAKLFLKGGRSAGRMTTQLEFNKICCRDFDSSQMVKINKMPSPTGLFIVINDANGGRKVYGWLEDGYTACLRRCRRDHPADVGARLKHHDYFPRGVPPGSRCDERYWRVMSVTADDSENIRRCGSYRGYVLSSVSTSD
jgi:hypothetical protein